MGSYRPGRWKKKPPAWLLEDSIGTEGYECLVCHVRFRSRSILATHRHDKEKKSER